MHRFAALLAADGTDAGSHPQHRRNTRQKRSGLASLLSPVKKPTRSAPGRRLTDRFALGSPILNAATILRERVGLDEADPDPSLAARGLKRQRG